MTFSEYLNFTKEKDKTNHEIVFCCKNCSDLLTEKKNLLKLKAEGGEFCKIFDNTRTVKGQNDF